MTNKKIKVEEVVEIYECLKAIIEVHGKKPVQRILDAIQTKTEKKEE